MGFYCNRKITRWENFTRIVKNWLQTKNDRAVCSYSATRDLCVLTQWSEENNFSPMNGYRWALFPEGLYSTGHCDKANLPSYIYSSYLFFNIKGMKVVIVSELGTSWHIFQGIQSDPVHAINRPREKGRGLLPRLETTTTGARISNLPLFLSPVTRVCWPIFPPPQSVSCSIPPTGYCQTTVLNQFPGKHALCCRLE